MASSSPAKVQISAEALANVGARILRARIRLALSQPFLASALMRLPLREVAESSWCQTMATDGHHIFFNPVWTAHLKDNEIRGVLAHEVLHVVFDHNGRRKSRHAELWNLAADYAINLLLSEQGFRLPEGGAIDRFFSGMPAEEIYESLLKVGNVTKNLKGKFVSDSDSDLSETMENTVPLTGTDLIEPGDPRAQAHHGANTPDREQLAELRAELRHDMESKLKGRAAALFKIECLAADDSKIDWRAVMRSWLLDRVKSDWSSIPFSKKHIHRGMYFPSLGIASLGHIVFAMDTSGSMSENELSEIVAEIRAFRETFPCRLTIIQADAAIGDIKEYEEMDGMEIPKRMAITGRGGTSFIPIFDWIDQAPIGSSVVLIYATDGYGDFPMTKPSYPVLWLATKSAIQANKFPFGVVVRMKSG
jgi:predicted metal-dependent peptidase